MNNDLDHNDQELQLLYRGIKRAKGFQLFLAQCDNQVLREKIQESLKRQLESGGITVYYQHLNAPMESLDEFLPRGVTIHKNEKAVLLVSGFEKSVLDTAEPQFFLHRLNFARDLLPKKIPIPLVLWLPAVVFKKILTEAHDLWSWRSGTFYFSETPKIELFQLSEGISKASFTEKEKPGVISEKFYKEQLAYFTHLLEDLSSSEGPGTTGLQQADVMQQMGDLHYSYAKTLRQPEQRKECLEQALAFQEKALDIKESLMGTLHPEVAKSYANLASIYFDMVQLDRALEFQLKDIEISEKILDKNHPSLATSYNNVSLIYKDMGQLDRALEFQLKSLSIREAVLDKNHPSLASSYNNVSMIYQDMGQLDRALEFQLKAVAILQKLFPNGHPNLNIMKKNLELLQLEMMKDKKKQS